MIGEAANHVSGTFKKAHPEIPWKGIIGQRNVLAHEYGEILVERIWLVATERIPELLKLLDPLIPRLRKQSLMRLWELYCKTHSAESMVQSVVFAMRYALCSFIPQRFNRIGQRRFDGLRTHG